ncbi:MAG: branched-chain amino acid ABC transporter permease, partial [Deltaproteobacteria bacterium]|nr:branched-chain amino acid ABC transporter permease [Deltaproteobacteria bacterium]
IYIIFNESIALTEGPDGFGNIPHLSLFGFTFDTILANYYLIWAVAILMLIFSLNIIHSRVGRALMSIHGSEVAAMTMGVNAAKFKIQVFVISAVMASIAGSLYAHYVQFINPPVFDLFFSIKLVMMVVVGGMASVWGAILGAALITFLPEWLIFLEDFDILAYGLVLLLIIMFLPKGLSSLTGVLYRLVAPRLKSGS